MNAGLFNLSASFQTIGEPARTGSAPMVQYLSKNQISALVLLPTQTQN